MSEMQDSLKILYEGKLKNQFDVSRKPGLVKRLYKKLDKIFKDENETMDPWLMRDFTDVVGIISDGRVANIFDPQKDKLQDFVLDGFDFLARSQEEGLGTYGVYRAGRQGNHHYQTGLVESLLGVCRNEETRIRAHDYIFETISDWYGYSDNLIMQNDTLIETALSVGHGLPTKEKFETNKFLVERQQEDVCKITEFMQDGRKIVYQWDSASGELKSKNILKNE